MKKAKRKIKKRKYTMRHPKWGKARTVESAPTQATHRRKKYPKTATALRKVASKTEVDHVVWRLTKEQAAAITNVALGNLLGQIRRTFDAATEQ